MMQGPIQLPLVIPHTKTIIIEGEKPAVVFEEMQLSDTAILSGETIKIKVLAKNLLPYPRNEKVQLFLNNEEFSSQSVQPGRK